MKRGKKYVEAAKLVDGSKVYSANEALDLACKTSTAKFDASVDVAFRLNIDPRKAEQKEAGADFVGDSDMIVKINQGWFEFDVIVATPDMMGELGRLGRVLGPKGLMPNPKTGTVTMNVAQAVKEIKAGKVEYRPDKVGNIQMTIGKVSFGADKLQENLKAVYEALVKARPSTVKGSYVKNVSVASTMGPGIKVDSESITKK